MHKTLSFVEEMIPIMEKIPDNLVQLDIAVDESKRPKECRNLMKEYKDIPELYMGTSGTYIKLNQDEI